MLITDCCFINKALYLTPEMKNNWEAHEEEEYSNQFAMECAVIKIGGKDVFKIMEKVL